MLAKVSQLGRKFLPADTRRRLKAVVDPLLATVGSVQAARKPTSVVALTFDDGPDATVTPQVLDLLRQAGARATFFILSDHAERLPHIVRDIVAQGHEIGLHSDRHDRLTQLSTSEVRSRLAVAKAAIEAISGKRITLFRPPYGAQTLATFMIAKSLGLQTVVWGPYAEDWLDSSPEAAAAKVLDVVRGGEIALFHDGLELDDHAVRPALDRARVVELVLDGFKARGLTADTVSAMIDESGARKTGWFRT